jgi:pilus assembly protein Flp/PilA
MVTLTKYYLHLSNFFTSLLEDEGQSLAEYGLILALIAVVAIAAVTALGGNISSYLQQVADGFDGGG